MTITFVPGRKLRADRGPMLAVERQAPHIEYMTDDQLLASVGKDFVFDVESYWNYFLISFMCVETQRVVALERTPDGTFNIDKLDWILNAVCLYGFNSNIYDLPMAYVSRVTTNTQRLKEITNKLIKGVNGESVRPWQIYDEFGIVPWKINHVDLIEVAPLSASLKAYAARMHMRRLQELPYKEDAILSREEAQQVFFYNVDADLPATRALRLELADQIAMREGIGKQYGEDVRSKSDAQIAEVIIRSELKKLSGREPKPAEFEPGYTFRFQVPPYIRYATPGLQRVLDIVTTADFVVSSSGSPQCPQVQAIELDLGPMRYAMGLGGLHSQESCVSHYADDEWVIEDNDVASYYPKLILNAGMVPRGCGPLFREVFQSIVDRRLAAKERMTAAKKAGRKPEAADETEANSLKITANGTFGKLGNVYSAMYSPDLLIQVTLSGQLCLLLFIEMMTLAGITCVSGNTDGVILRYHKSQKATVDAVRAEWSRITNLEMETTLYRSIHNRDVNNYIAIKTDGEAKLKGVYAEKGSTGNSRLSKNPEALIVSDALVKYIVDKKPIHETVNACNDFTRFLCVRKVKGGAVKSNVYLGSIVRWYYGKNERGTIDIAGSGNKVPKTEGAIPCMDLPNGFPANLDRDRYVALAIEALADIGVLRRNGSLF